MKPFTRCVPRSHFYIYLIFCKAAVRELKEECGPNMDVWMVGRQPIGHYEYPYPTDSQRNGYNAAKVPVNFIILFYLFIWPRLTLYRFTSSKATS